VATALVQTGRYDFDRRYALDPATLFARLRPSYGPAQAVELPAPPRESWCQRSWQQWASFRQWCAWACIESWLFCW
jgi:hypothetical protein